MPNRTSREQSPGEEIANSVSHGISLIAAVFGVPVVVEAAIHLGTANIVGASIYALTMVLLFLTSTLYHASPKGGMKRLLLKFDQGAIYVFIAGSYTPFALGESSGVLDWLLFGLIWVLAISGATLKAFDRLRHPGLSAGLYLIMGWFVLTAVLPLIRSIPSLGLNLLVAGGLMYSGGIVFYLLDTRLHFGHAVWHGFVTVASALHFFSVLIYEA